MEIKQTLTIGKHFVTEIARVKPNLVVYEVMEDNQGVAQTLFFTQNGKVLFSMYISADCSQNVGFIDDITFNEVKD